MKMFQPIRIRGMEVPNRIVYPPIQLNIGLTNRRARAFYGERARGGTGLVIAAATSIDILACEELWGGPDELAGFLERLRRLTDHVHESSVKIGIQLWQENRFPQGWGVHSGGKEVDPGEGARVAPSPREDMRELTIPEIEAIIYRFAVAARRVRDAGFDCVELHGAHGYLACQFTDPNLNQRQDKYGGDARRRMRFGIDLITAVRAFVGPDYPVLFRLGALEQEDGSIHPDSVDYARELEKAGVDCLDVSASSFGKAQVIPNRRYKLGTLVFLAEAVKKNVGIPVIGVGRINTPEIAEEILESGRADLVAIGRQLIADPFWPKKVREGRLSEIVACDSCNINCNSPIFYRRLPEGASLCKLNKRAGKESEIPATEPA